MDTSARPNQEKMNVGREERTVSMVGGGALLLWSLARRSAMAVPLALSGGYLLYRGVSGKCPLYGAMDIHRADGEGIKVERSLTIAKPVAEVFNFWRNFGNLPRFMNHLERVEITGERTSRWVAKTPLDLQVEWEAEITEERQNELIAWRSLPGSEVENSGSVRFKSAPGDRGTEIIVNLEFQPPGGSAGAAVAKLFGKHPDRQVREDLRRFKQIMETGETATVSGQSSSRH